MQNRPQEETWLSDAIKARNIEGVENLIEFIQNKTPQPNSAISSPRLDRLDETGKSFLFLSIEYKCKSIAKQLFELQKNDPAILFAVNNKKQTLAWRAAKSHNTEMLRKIIDACKTQQDPHNNSLPIWLRVSDEGNTPLHAAVSSHGKKTVSFLLETLKNNLSSARLLVQLNQTNLNGDTLLHLAMQTKHFPIAALLAKAGGDWTVINNEGKSPFDYFCESDASAQNILLSELEVSVTHSDDTHQAQLLNLFQKKVLDANSHNKVSAAEKSTLEKHYHDLASMVSLRDLIWAKASTNEKIHAVLTPQKSIGLPHGRNVLLEEEDEDNEQDAPSLIDEPLSDYQQIREDRGMLNKLIQDIDVFVTDLKNNPRISERKKKLAVILPILGWLIYFGVEGFFIYERFVIIPSLPCEHPYGDSLLTTIPATAIILNHSPLPELFIFGMLGVCCCPR